MDFNNYNQRKERLTTSLQQLMSIIDELRMTDLALKIRADQKQLDDEKFILVVVGDFSRGKSTFVNAMLGRKLLPSSKKPTTTVISKILYGDIPRYWLVYKDGKRKELGEKEFLNVKVPKDEDENSEAGGLLSFTNKLNPMEFLAKRDPWLNVDYAEVYYPLPFCKNGVEVVDTPGINDINDNRINITYNYLNKAEAAILVLAANQALSASELEFLKERVLGNQIKDIFIVINFKDQALGEEERVINFVKANLGDVPVDQNKIFLVSSKQALALRRQENGEPLKTKELVDLPASLDETGFVDFETVLTKFLAEEKGNAKLQKYTQRSLLYIKDIERDITSRINASEHSADELKQQLAEAKPEFERIKRTTNKIVTEMQATLSIKTQELEDMCDAAVQEMRSAALAAVDDYEDGMDEDDIKRLINAAVTPIKKQLIEDVNREQTEALKKASNAAVDKLSNIFKDITFSNDVINIEAQISSALSISMGSSDDNDNSGWAALGAGILAAIAGLSGIGIFFASIFGSWFYDRATRVDPRTKIRQAIRRDFAKNYDDFAPQVCRQYQKNSRSLCDRLQSTVTMRLQSMENQLQDLIAQKENKETDASQIRAELERKLAATYKVKNALLEVEY